MQQDTSQSTSSGGRIVEERLSNKNTVKLAYWENERPTEHGDRLQAKSWNQHKGREGLGFYESTVQYMRNDWAAQHMSPKHVTDGNGWHGMLYYSGVTKTWHTNDALDIDHATQWKPHLQSLGVRNMADAMMAYNDVDNLRMLPSVYNRARDSADKVLEKHGEDSSQWRNWVNERFTFDNAVQYAPFDPEKDFARRKQTTRDQVWTEDNTRSELSFDKRVMEKWFNSELQKNHAGNVTMTNPDGSGTTQVPLFKCAATGQLVTRDALDIDHAIPFEQVVKKMHEMFPSGFSKADALDAYNDTSNLRLVSRSANSSHEWELMPDGHFRDKVEKEIPGEFRKFIVDTGPMDPQTRHKLGEVLGEMRDVQRFQMEQYWLKERNPQPQTSTPPNTPLGQDPSTRAPLLNESGHPHNKAFQFMVGEIGKLDPNGLVFKTPDERERMASALLVVAAHHKLPSIDTVSWSKDGMSVFAGSGDPSHGKFVWLGNSEGVSQSVERNTQSLAMALQPSPMGHLQAQAQGQTQGQSSTPHSHHF
ncbi:MAG: XVIPCD domain-containing protein [Lysobacteraceae bacterium]